MSSVTGRSTDYKQPYGGFIKPSSFEKTVLDDGITLNESENIASSSIGLAVDYLSRFMNGVPLKEAFKISITGMHYAVQDNAGIISEQEAKAIISGIKGLDDKSVVNACKLVSFDVWGRDPNRARSLPYNQTNPDKATIQNIQTMVKRSLTFFEKYGPVVAESFRFAPASERIVNDDGSIAYNLAPFFEMMETRKGSYGGYTPTVDSGEGDFLTKDTLWEFKVYKSKLTSQITLQLLMYWIMGQHSGQSIYKGITKLGVFNPRLNTVYLYDTQKIPAEVIRTVEKDVICYE